MSGKSILFSALVVFAIVGLFKVFRSDTTDPNAVMKRYLSHWESNNTTGMYPLISERAKAQLARQKVNNVSDYYSYFVEHRGDLTGFADHITEDRQRQRQILGESQIIGFCGKRISADRHFSACETAGRLAR